MSKNKNPKTEPIQTPLTPQKQPHFQKPLLPPIRHLHKAPHLNLSMFSVQGSTFNIQIPPFVP
jgi:hypothetical protein